MDIFFTSDHNNATSNIVSFLDFQTPGWIFSLLVALPENAYVIWLIVTGAGNGVAAEFFSLNLCVCEIIFCLQSFLYLVSRAFPDLWFVAGFLLGFSSIGRPLFQCLICVECYLAVVHPVTFLKYRPLRYKVICSAVAWIFILLSCVFATFAVTEFQTYAFACYCLCQALVTLSIKLFCCLAVLRALNQSGPGERKREEENHMKRRAFNIIVMIIMAMLLIYASYLFTALSYVLAHGFILTLWSIGQVCFVLGGLVQPFLYLHRTGKLPFYKAP